MPILIQLEPFMTQTNIRPERVLTFSVAAAVVSFAFVDVVAGLVGWVEVLAGWAVDAFEAAGGVEAEEAGCAAVRGGGRGQRPGRGRDWTENNSQFDP